MLKHHKVYSKELNNRPERTTIYTQNNPPKERWISPRQTLSQKQEEGCPWEQQYISPPDGRLTSLPGSPTKTWEYQPEARQNRIKTRFTEIFPSAEIQAVEPHKLIRLCMGS